MEGNGLRDRKYSQKAMEANGDAQCSWDQKKPKKTLGKTPDGTVFTVPYTHDMVSQLLSPSQPKNLSDLMVLAILAFHILTIYLLPSTLRVPVYAAIFIFWRACYNIGIGYLLHLQSRHWKLVAWAKRSKIFVNPSTGDNPHPTLYYILKREMETKIPEDYKFDEVPIEYNTWLVFRRVVDLILMCDFVSYVLFALACGEQPLDEGIFLTVSRWIFGWVLVGFNLWVKLDAHRVVKDYAWYWGDFFYLIDQELTFDGVFEMAPHPMYTVGYAGYYGISAMAASYKVLFISIIAHLAQIAFLEWVENPHIEKTYNPPPPRRQPSEATPKTDDEYFHAPEADEFHIAPPLATPNQPSPVHNLIGLKNIDLYRVTDTSVLLLQLCILALTVLTPSTPPYQAFFVINAAVWRMWYTVGAGYLLNRQSTKKRWMRHFLKYGESTEEAWRQWKGTYHLAMTMCYASFVAASWKMYSLPEDWTHQMILLRHVVGMGLIALQVWTSVSIYESLGEFGWFFGDFFFDCSPKLTYSGIYRFLNNPERVIGLAGVWGAALITRSGAIFYLALLSHVLTLMFIQLVERPHMQKLYGRSLRRESGLVKSLKRSLPPHLLQWRGNIDKVLERTVDSLEDSISAANQKIAARMSLAIKNSTALFKHRSRMAVKRVASEAAGYDPQHYSLKIEGTPSHASSSYSTTASGRENVMNAEQRSDLKPISFEYGAPIKVQWTAPLNHSKRDWIGLYKVADNVSKEITQLSSQGRWVATNKDQFGSIVADRGIIACDTGTSGATRNNGSDQDYVSGTVEFSEDKLWWDTGVFEFRYHHNGKHNVMAVSIPFEIKTDDFDEEEVELDAKGSMRSAVQASLLHLVKNCFDRDPNIAPSTFEEAFGSPVHRDGKYAKRVVFAIHQMFDIEFAPEIIQADGNVRNLAWRICYAKRVLEPFVPPLRGRHATTNSIS